MESVLYLFIIGLIGAAGLLLLAGAAPPVGAAVPTLGPQAALLIIMLGALAIAGLILWLTKTRQ